ncbi:MAG: UrcA family protein [Maricaulis sp.]|jgi:UrcA family protein|nr:UrcA family protein [Maricaulis sp.]
MKTFKTSTFASLLVTALIAGATITNPAAATPETFNYDRQELLTLSGARDVLIRLEATARSVCFAESRYGGQPTAATSACMEDTISRAVAQIDAACLSQVHAGDLHVEPEQSCDAEILTD